MTIDARTLLAVPLLLAVAACAPEPLTAAPTHSSDRPRKALHAQSQEKAPSGPPVSVLDLDDPQVAHLDPGLRAAVAQAARDARTAGVPFWITSGWRSRAHQQRLLDEAVAKYGSLQEALRYVSTPDTSRHVSGDAVDIGPAAADRWLSEHGSAYGLCQVLANEMWHFELATTPGGSCPSKYADARSR